MRANTLLRGTRKSQYVADETKTSSEGGPDAGAHCWRRAAIIAIAGRPIVHPILFVLGILALVAFLIRWRVQTTRRI
jgi:hypothetical protein